MPEAGRSGGWSRVAANAAQGVAVIESWTVSLRPTQSCSFNVPVSKDSPFACVGVDGALWARSREPESAKIGTIHASGATALHDLLLSRWLFATFYTIFDPVLYTDEGVVFIVRFGMSIESPSSPPADEVPADRRPASQRNTGEGAESVLSEIKRHHRVDELVNHGPEYDPPMPVSDHTVELGS